MPGFGPAQRLYLTLQEKSPQAAKDFAAWLCAWGNHLKPKLSLTQFGAINLGFLVRQRKVPCG
jgi:hypothetical protein